MSGFFTHAGVSSPRVSERDKAEQRKEEGEPASPPSYSLFFNERKRGRK